MNNKIILDEKIFYDIKLFEHEKTSNSVTKKIINNILDKKYVKSIICCSKTMLIIDGHHRYNALKYLNLPVPITFINYKNSNIRINPECQITKEEVIKAGIDNILFEVKATKHEVLYNGTWEPISIISKKFNLINNFKLK